MKVPKPFQTLKLLTLFFFLLSFYSKTSGQNPTNFYSKPTGDFHNLGTWGTNFDGSGFNPTNFDSPNIFNMSNRSGNFPGPNLPFYELTGDWTVGGKINFPGASMFSLGTYKLTISQSIQGLGVRIGSRLLANRGSELVIAGTNAGTESFYLATPGTLVEFDKLTINRPGVVDFINPVAINGIVTILQGSISHSGFNESDFTIRNGARVGPSTYLANATVEYSIPARRAWRIMCSPTSFQSINSAWQEGATTSFPNPNRFPRIWHPHNPRQ